MTVACSAAKFTLASFTPGTFLRPFSMRIAQEAHVMPSRASIARLSPIDSAGDWDSSAFSTIDGFISEAIMITFIFACHYTHTPLMGVLIVYKASEQDIKGWISRG